MNAATKVKLITELTDLHRQLTDHLTKTSTLQLAVFNLLCFIDSAEGGGVNLLSSTEVEPNVCN
jgi:hypothetical protein